MWTQYFEDVLIYPDYRINLNQYSPLETARYLLEHPELDAQAVARARSLLEWVAAEFAKDSTTMAGLPEQGRQWGAEVVSEQVNDMDKMASHTARFASVCALYYAATGEAGYRERAFRSFNWATYASRQDGLVLASLDQPTGYWFSDGYGDYMRHFQRGLACVPEWAPAKAPHLLGSTSVVRAIRYGEDEIEYRTFDPQAREELRLPELPRSVRAGWRRLPRLDHFEGRQPGYTARPLEGGGFAVSIQHEHSGQIKIRLNKSASEPGTGRTR